MHLTKIFWAPAFICVVLLAATAVNAAPIDDAKVFLRDQKPAQAMQLLEQHLDGNLQDVEYNYLLGIASLDAGKPGNAVFAFERVLAIEPRHSLARAELARAYIALTEFEAARQQLQQIDRRGVPAEAGQKIDQVLADLNKALAEQAALKGRRPRTLTGYVEALAGHDSNINTAPNATSVFIPALNLPGVLSGFATAKSSSLLGVNGGIAGQISVSQEVDFYANADGRFRNNYNQDGFDTGALSGGIGARLSRGIDQFSAGLTQFTYYISRFRNDDQTGVYGQWQREFSKQNIGGLFAQYLSLNHPIIPALTGRGDR